jgi:hypothetical protein
MQAHAQCQWCHRYHPQTLLACRQKPAEFERHAYSAPGIVFVSHRDPKHDHETLAHHRMESSFILVYYVLGKGMESKK